MTLYLIDVKSLVDMNDHIRWQTSKETGHISASVLRKRRRPAFSPATRVSSAGYFCQTKQQKMIHFSYARHFRA